MLIRNMLEAAREEFRDEPAKSEQIRRELSTGLQLPQAEIAPKYFYDDLGSKLFEAICELPEYYPTRTESSIFDMHMLDIARSVGRGGALIDLGAGNCKKAARLFPALRPAQYVAIDISAHFLRAAVGNLRQRFPQIAMLELGLDFSHSLELPKRVRSEKRLFFYPGSSIGNFVPSDALGFLRRIRAECSNNGQLDGGLLIGVDLVKDIEILNAAYDDALGVTASFNLNVLPHVNRLLGTDFDLRDWRHRSFFDAQHSRIEMHLMARRRLTVAWDHGRRHFAEGESIHTENSYKYTKKGFLALLAEAGFGKTSVWTDPDDWFMICHAQA